MLAFYNNNIFIIQQKIHIFMRCKVALLDAGAQLEKVIMRRVLEQGYEVDKFPVNVQPSKIKDYDAIIISGGPKSVNDENALLPDAGIYELGKPILGICYGMQAIAQQLGGKVARGEKGQYGRNYIQIFEEGGLFKGLQLEERVLMSHFDEVKEIPKEFKVYARSEGQIAAIGNEKTRIVATQYHPELIPITKNGSKMFENFFRNICRFPEAEKRTIEEDIENAKNIIKEAVGTDKSVMHYLSGGIDSTVMAVMLKELIEPERLHIRTLDTGGMRIGEIEEIKELAEKLKLPNFKVLDVKNNFYNSRREIKLKKKGLVWAGPLCYVTDPEIKRNLFGTEYAIIAIAEIEDISKEHNVPKEDILLGQASLRPDKIESADENATKGEADTIKTHHNAVEALKHIPKVEPFIDLFKDQIRQIALAYGLEEKIAYKQPYPGPGQYCRIICTENKKTENNFKELNGRVNEIASMYGFKAFVLPIKTVGVQGDERSYKHPVIVSGEADWKELAKLSLKLPNEIREINRVVYMPGKPLTEEQARLITPTWMVPGVIRQAQECDKVMRDVAEKYGYNDSRVCSQMPGILIPCGLGDPGKRAYVMRPCWTYDLMAVIGMMPYKEEPSQYKEEFFPEEMYFEIAEATPRKVKGISRVIIDVSDKPPGSTEWE